MTALCSVAPPARASGAPCHERAFRPPTGAIFGKTPQIAPNALIWASWQLWKTSPYIPYLSTIGRKPHLFLRWAVAKRNERVYVVRVETMMNAPTRSINPAHRKGHVYPVAVAVVRPASEAIAFTHRLDTRRAFRCEVI